MMLRTLLPGLSQRYAFAGSAIGALLPALGMAAEAMKQGGNYQISMHFAEPVHALILTVPLLSGMIFHHVGHMRAEFTRQLRARDVSARLLLALSLKDWLTGLPNRRALEGETVRFLAAKQHGHFRPAYLLLDLDKFKQVNDTLGHEAGDELLRQFSARFSGTLGSFVQLYRLGGDEFVITVAGSPSDNEIERLCRVINTRLDEPFQLKAGRAIVGASMGISCLEAGDKGLADVLRRADVALYISKETPGTVSTFHQGRLGKSAPDQIGKDHPTAYDSVQSMFVAAGSTPLGPSAFTAH